MLVQKTLELALDSIFSYFNAIPNSRFNHVYATPVGQSSKQTTIPRRTDNIGYAQFRLQFAAGQPKSFTVRRFNVRVERKYSNGNLFINAGRSWFLKSCDLLVFGDSDITFVSVVDNSWLRDSKYYTEMPYGGTLVHEYNVWKLLADRKIYALCHPNMKSDKECVAFQGDLTNADDARNFRRSFTLKPFSKEKAALAGLRVQYDPRTPSLVYFCPEGYQYTDRPSTAGQLAKDIAHHLGIDEKSTYQKILYAKRQTKKTGKAIPARVAVGKNFDTQKIEALQDSNPILYKTLVSTGDYILYVSDSPNFDVFASTKVKKTENLTEYHKLYKKTHGFDDYWKKYVSEHDIIAKNRLYNRVKVYLKRHSNNYNPKWNNDELKVADKILGRYPAEAVF